MIDFTTSPSVGPPEGKKYARCRLNGANRLLHNVFIVGLSYISEVAKCLVKMQPGTRKTRIAKNKFGAANLIISLTASAPTDPSVGKFERQMLFEKQPL